MATKPKDPTSAYVMFSSTDAVKLAVKDLAFKDQAAKKGLMWKELPRAEKEKYERIYAEEKIKYFWAMAKYNEEKEEKQENGGGDVLLGLPMTADAGVKRNKDGSEKKRVHAKSGYNVFMTSKMTELIAQHPNTEFSQYGKMVSAAWSALTEEEKQVFRDEAKLGDEAPSLKRVREEEEAAKAAKKLKAAAEAAANKGANNTNKPVVNNTNKTTVAAMPPKKKAVAKTTAQQNTISTKKVAPGSDEE